MADFVRYFELATLCYLPTSWDRRDVVEISGVFIDGVNTPGDGELIDSFLDPDLNFQFLLEVNGEAVDLWIQLLLDMNYSDFLNSKREISMSIYTGLSETCY